MLQLNELMNDERETGNYGHFVCCVAHCVLSFALLSFRLFRFFFHCVSLGISIRICVFFFLLFYIQVCMVHNRWKINSNKSNWIENNPDACEFSRVNLVSLLSVWFTCNLAPFRSICDVILNNHHRQSHKIDEKKKNLF